MKNLLLTVVIAFIPILLAAQNHNCIDLSNLNSDNITCTYGKIRDPFENIGVMDQGPDSQRSRHTVVRAVSYDPRTGCQLRTIPEGENYAVRLGNWDIGGEAESVTCSLDVDTAQYDLLVLRYAAIMEDRYGDHAPDRRPRFTMDILDEDGNPINPGCTAADFVADSTLGWNAYDTIMHGHNSVLYWKDWTSVGVDLAEYHGRTIKVRLVTYDCADGGCFGYAYFRLDCQKKQLEASYCGLVEDIAVMAPDGFNYRWYFEHEPDVIISEERTAHVTMMENATLCCYVSFIENPDCGFVLKTLLTFRYPMAAFTWRETGCLGIVAFDNESFVSDDGVHPLPQWEPCQSAHWDFGDGTSSDEYDIEHQYEAIGNYEVVLVAKLNDGACTDTLRRNIHVSTAGMLTDTTSVTSCASYEWNGVVYDTPGYHSQMIQSHNGCDSLAVINLTIESTITYDFSIDTCGQYVWNGQAYNVSGTYQQAFPTGSACDSLVTLHLNMIEAEERFIDTTACERFVWNDTVFTTPGQHQSTYVSTLGCEGMVHFNLKLDYAPRPTGIYAPVMGHYVVPATEYQVNDFDYFIADSNAYNVWDSVVWAVSQPDWVVESGVGYSCRLLPVSYTPDTVWLSAKVYGGCAQQPVERRLWLICSFYGLEEAGDLSVQLAPNPTRGELWLWMPELKGTAIVTLYDLFGQTVRRLEIGSDTMMIDLADLRKGLYLLRIEEGHRQVLRKVILM